MPSTYAHYRMGQEVLKAVPKNMQKQIIKYKELFHIGLHGPDILFYYHPLIGNSINSIGYEMHKHAGGDFFSYAKEIINRSPKRTAASVYIYGFLCHFALDVTCHAYIDEKIAQSGVSHAEIEVEFDRELMLRDGFDPIRHKLTKHIVPSMQNAAMIYPFFEHTTQKEVQKALKGMITYNNLLVAPSKTKRQFVYALLRISGNDKEMNGLMVNFYANPKCKDSTQILSEKYEMAKNLAVELITEYERYLRNGQPLNPIYDYNFGGIIIKDKEQAK